MYSHPRYVHNQRLIFTRFRRRAFALEIAFFVIAIAVLSFPFFVVYFPNFFD